MPKLADELERHSQRVDLPPGGFERLARRRDRRQRNRRISATVLPIAIALLGLTAFIRAFGHGPMPASTPTPAPVGTYRLAYGNDGDIYVTDAKGKNPVRIANGVGSGPHTCGSYRGEGSLWSPNGRYFAFRGECPDTMNIADPTGRIIASFPIGMGWLISWSPDSTRVAAWARGGDVYDRGDLRIGVYGIDGLQKVL